MQWAGVMLSLCLLWWNSSADLVVVHLVKHLRGNQHTTCKMDVFALLCYVRIFQTATSACCTMARQLSLQHIQLLMLPHDPSAAPLQLPCFLTADTYPFTPAACTNESKEDRRLVSNVPPQHMKTNGNMEPQSSHPTEKGVEQSHLAYWLTQKR